ncbi:MAG: acetolactate synthase small subunit [Spirochaetia bacterium]
MTHVISLHVENRQGVLSRIAGLFSGRGYNLESLTAGVTHDPSVSRITLVCKGDDNVITQIKKQLNRLIDVIKVVDLTASESIQRELALIKLKVNAKQRTEILQVAKVFRARVMDIATDTMVLEITGNSEKVDNYIQLLHEYPILEIARSGLVSLERGKKFKKTEEA